MTDRRAPNRSTAKPHDRSSVRPTMLTFHVQPRAKRTEVVGWHGDAIKVRLAAPPVDGAANHALLTFLAEALHVPSNAVTLESGTAARRKRIAVSGRSLEEVHRALGLD